MSTVVLCCACLQVAAAKGKTIAFLLDTKGPEVRTAMLRGGKDIELEAGQEVTVVAVGDEYTTWEGYKDEATGNRSSAHTRLTYVLHVLVALRRTYATVRGTNLHLFVYMTG